MSRIFVVLIATFTLMCWGCSDQGATPQADERVAAVASPVQQAQPTDVQLVAWMEAHYSATILAHDALMQGDLVAFRSQLGRASRLESPPAMPAVWAPLLEGFRAAARSGERVESLDAAGGALASVVVSCGTCHSALGAGPVYPAPAPDDAVNEFQAAMFDHQWAMERLWEGVTGPWDVAWNRGAAALVETRVFGDALGQLEGDLLEREQELKALGQEAQRATALDDRAVIYGRLLSRCGDCHSAANVTIEPDD